MAANVDTPSAITKIVARQVFDSRGNPTVEADVYTHKACFRAAAPSGASTGIYEAVELRDKGTRWMGKGVSKAVENVIVHISPALKGMDPKDQNAVDAKMIQLDGSDNKSRLGANAIVAVSLAVAKAGAAEKGKPLYRHLAELAGNTNLVLPVPAFNVVNGGRHAGNALAMQEFLIIPKGAKTFSEAMAMGTEVYHHLKAIIKHKYGLDATNVGDEGGFAPNISSSNDALHLITDAIEAAGYTGKVKIGIDPAASEFYSGQGYDLNFKDQHDNKTPPLTGDELLDVYKGFCQNFPIVFVEDPYDQDDFDYFSKLTAEGFCLVVGDDLLVTNPKRIRPAIDGKWCNALLLKVNQIGTVTEAIEAVAMAKEAGWGIMTSHRSGETEDSFIADLAVGLSTELIKSGAPCRSERLAKYNQLLRIEEELGQDAVYAGDRLRVPEGYAFGLESSKRV